MALQHLHLFAVFEAHNEIRCDGLFDRYRRITARYRSGLASARLDKCLIDLPDQLGQLSRGDLVVRDMSGDDIANQRQQFGRIYVSHFVFFPTANSPRISLAGFHSTIPGLQTRVSLVIDPRMIPWRRDSSLSSVMEPSALIASQNNRLLISPLLQSPCQFPRNIPHANPRSAAPVELAEQKLNELCSSVLRCPVSRMMARNEPRPRKMERWFILALSRR